MQKWCPATLACMLAPAETRPREVTQRTLATGAHAPILSKLNFSLSACKACFHSSSV